MFALTLILASVVLLGPPLAVIGLVRWGRRLSKQGAPRGITRTVYVVATMTALAVLSGYVIAFVGAHSSGDTTTQPSQKAQRLAEGISEVMNSAAVALLIAGLGSGAIVLWRRSSR